MTFEVEYTDRATGEVVCTQVKGHRMARQLAKELAKANGKRAIVRRVSAPAVDCWSVHLANARTGETEQVWTGLTKHEVLLRWKLWKERRTQCVLVAWPDWMPLRLSMEEAA